jgi:hypothetical protein
MEQMGAGELLVVVVVALAVIGVVWKIVTGIIRLVLTIAVIGFVLLVVVPYLTQAVGAS